MITQDFITSNTGLVRNLFYKKNSSLTEDDIEDLLQETWYAVTLFQDSYNPNKGTIGTFLGLIVTHVYDRYTRGSDALNPELIDDVPDVTADDIVLSNNEHYYMQNKDHVDQYMSWLPKKQRDILHLRLILGYTHEEIAKALDITEGNSSTLCSRAMKNLSKLIESKDPSAENITESKVLRTRGDVPYSGDWAWRPNESPDRSPGMVNQYTAGEVLDYCQENNIKYAYDI